MVAFVQSIAPEYQFFNLHMINNPVNLDMCSMLRRVVKKFTLDTSCMHGIEFVGCLIGWEGRLLLKTPVYATWWYPERDTREEEWRRLMTINCLSEERTIPV